MDLDLLQARLDYFFALEYISYHTETKAFPLTTANLLVALKVFSMKHGLSFPRVNAKSIRGSEAPVVYLTELGEKHFTKYLQVMSVELFEMIAPIYTGQVNPSTFAFGDTPLYKNIMGTSGKVTRSKPKPPLQIHLLVDNSEPYDYLKSEYIFDSIYEARLFINKLVVYVPPTRLELWRVRVDAKTGQTRKDPEPVLITKAPYKV